VFPEFVIAAVTSSVLGWGALTWRKSEQAKEAAEIALHKIDQIELKVAEEYLSKKDFDQSMDRMLDGLKEIKQDMKYLTERMNYHIDEQGGEIKALRERVRHRRWL